MIIDDITSVNNIYFLDRLLNNPWAEPPSANDWLVQPTYPRHNPMPYYLAPLWDVHYKRTQANTDRDHVTSAADAKHRVPRELRIRLKRARAARGMLQNLEEDIRGFVQRWNDRQVVNRHSLSSSSEEDDYSDDEVVFVGRKGLRKLQEQDNGHISHDDDEVMVMSEEPSLAVADEKMVFESRADDRAAGFG